ncbi:MFS transporter [Gulosibacter bifidus]|uniref:MFS transporter n=1 Tax=Gulosibacter bifidus TaxID=272239 RepID=A0ABW5RIW9_9MICO|nr:MFS transporter [Gulosibacter bifidus]
MTTANTTLTTLDGTTLSHREQRRRAFAWQLYDLSQSAWQAVIVTFVFATYLSSPLFFDPQIAALPKTDPAYVAAQAESQQVIAGFDLIAGILVALIAPALGRTADGSGSRKRMLAVFSGLVVAVMLGMFFVRPDAKFLAIGAVLLASGTVLSELAFVNYNAMLSQVATHENVSKVSGRGWGLGYISSIVLLILLLVLFIQDVNGDAPGSGIFALPSGADGEALNIRLAIVFAAIWYLVFLIPILRRVPSAPRNTNERRVGFFGAYAELWRTLRSLWRTDRKLLQFLLASAVFRDGLNAVFAWGAVLAGQVYGFSNTAIMMFAIVANLVSGIGAFVGGSIEHRVGTKPTIIWSLIGMLIAGLGMMVLPDVQTSFWVVALLLCLFIGPVQSASRSYMARSIPQGREGELMGLYSTTGRAAGWLSNLLYFAFISMLMTPKAGVWGILLTLLIGLLLMWTVPAVPKIASLASRDGSTASADA